MRRHEVVGRLLMLAAVMGGGSLEGAASNEGSTVTGKAVFTGTPPAPQPIAFGAEKQCALVHGDHAPAKEDLVVNPNGTVRDVLVYVTDAVPGEFTPPAEPLVFEQRGCVFAPHVGAVMAGQPIEVRNDDPVLHNVRAQSKLGQSFNIAQPVQGMKTTKVLKKPEVGIPLKCDVHFWMTAYLHVLAHPFFAVTGEDGAFTLSGLPPGTYALEAWHPTLGAQRATVTVRDAETQTVEFAFANP